MLKKIKKKYIEDILINIVATSIPIILLQLIILPGINEKLGSNEYGLIISLISIFTLISSTSAGTLNNVRLLMDEHYREEHICGDFNLIQLILSFPSAIIVMIVGSIYIGGIDFEQIIGLAIVTILILADGYYSVGFRLQINYKRILIQKILLCIGYYLGYRIFLLTGRWIWIYCMAYVVELPYIFLKTNLLQEPWGKTKLFWITLKKEVILIVSSVIGGLATYLDKLLLYPLLGGVITSTYYVSTLMGKCISLAVFPISGVLLSYFSKIKKLSGDTVKMMSVFGWIVGLTGYFICLIVSKPLIGLLYPSLVDEAIRYVPINLLGTVFGVQSTVLNPIVLRYCDTKWQMLISAINVITYLVLSLVLLKLFGLFGFCIGGMITAVVKYGLFLFIYLFERRKDEENYEKKLTPKNPEI